MTKTEVRLHLPLQNFSSFKWCYLDSMFHRMVDVVIKGLESLAAIYLDDVVIFSESWEDHIDTFEKSSTAWRRVTWRRNPQSGLECGSATTLAILESGKWDQIKETSCSKEVSSSRNIETSQAISWAHWILSKNYRGLCHVGCLINRANKEIAARQSEVAARVRGCFRALK